MLEDRSAIESVADQITLLLLLKGLQDLGYVTHRLKLEKLVYFANVLGSILGEQVTNHQFFVWKYGPFSKQIYSDIEVLVTRGLVRATELETHDEADEKSFEYSITETGLIGVQKALADEEFKKKYDVILKSLQITAPLSSHQIKTLSYGEVDFRRAYECGRGTVIDPRHPLGNEMAILAKHVAASEFDLELSDEEASFLYLKLIEALSVG